MLASLRTVGPQTMEVMAVGFEELIVLAILVIIGGVVYAVASVRRAANPPREQRPAAEAGDPGGAVPREPPAQDDRS
ncbi:hypothetical protein ACU61A_05440 [Pseudonocardia sichuanensis]